MKIAVVSDTHSLELPSHVLKDIAKADLIIHAGDFCSLKDLEQFSKLREVKAVYGNMDDHQMKKRIPETLVFDVEGIRVGVYHGDGAPKGIIERVKAKLADAKIDLAIYGHTHTPATEKIGNTLYFNPGSLTDTVRAPYRSYGWVEINKGKISTKIVKVDN